VYKSSSLRKRVAQLGLALTLALVPAVASAHNLDIDASASSTIAASAEVAGCDASLDLTADNSTSGAISYDGVSAESEPTSTAPQRLSARNSGYRRPPMRWHRRPLVHCKSFGTLPPA
jgi:hypothetical protein